MVRPLNDLNIGIDTDEGWWAIGTVGGGEERKVNMSDGSKMLTGI